MSGTLGAGDPAEDTVAAALADLAANVPAETVLRRLRAVETHHTQPGPARARFLRARAVATNRLGLPERALADLLEARAMLERTGEPAELVEVLRTTALVHVWRGDGREAALTLLRAAAWAGTDSVMLADVLAEAGRLHIEIGRPQDANLLFARALAIGERSLSTQDRRRIAVNHLQALIAVGNLDVAQTHVNALQAMLAEAPRRFCLLIWIETMRLALARGQVTAARDALARAREFASPGHQSFSGIELTHAGAELALAEGDAARAEAMLRDVIARYAIDDLASREIGVRMQRARALAVLGRMGESDRELSAALRRALKRGLIGYADSVRTMIAARGGGENAFLAHTEANSEFGGADSPRFVRGRPLGSGGYGSVTRAYDLELGVEVAIKRVPLAGEYDIAVRTRLLDAARNEIAALSRVEHPGVVRVYGLTIDPQGDAQLIEELIEGPSLRTVMAEPVDRSSAFELLADIAFALAAIHAAGVVHRDLKPDNIILRNGGSPVLVDFGIALVKGRFDQSPATGTRDYMAPEQFRLRGKVDSRADIYALGVIAHELLLREMPERPLTRWSSPFRHGRAGSGRARLDAAGIDPAVADAIVRMLSPWPRQRPRSAAPVARFFSSAARRDAAPADDGPASGG